MQTFGQKLRLLRKQHGITLRRLAEQLSTSHGYIADLESGRRKPSLELARKVADVFDVSVDQLAKDELELDA
ncbi:helix-turn-helix transcriptional regulator [Anaerolineales bacterium HSG24]|nr:helix-turn-helix transcriptional regulator [Anaerolineales bacterium HSG24]